MVCTRGRRKWLSATRFVALTFAAALFAGFLRFPEFRASDESVPASYEASRDFLNELDSLGGYFTENQGQVSDEVRYYSMGNPAVAFRDDGIMFVISEKDKWTDSGSRFGFPVDQSSFRRSYAYLLRFEGADDVRPEAREGLPFKSNFFVGSDPGKWRTDVPNYGEILYSDLYDGIQLVYRSTEEGVKYEFVVSPGADPSEIKMTIEGDVSLEVDGTGMTVHTNIGDVRDSVPYSYQDSGEEVACRFAVRAARSYGFDCTTWDESKPLIIDPLVFSTYVGGSNWEGGTSVDLDSAGNVYVTGWTFSTDFPTTPGALDGTYSGTEDVFVTKLAAGGSAAVYSTYIGGNGDELGFGLKVNSTGGVFLTGRTFSTDFPVTPGALDTTPNGADDIFMTKLSETGGSLVYSTYLGGAGTDGGTSVGIDSSGNAYVTGWTSSVDFPVTLGAFDLTYNGGDDSFAAKLNAAGSVLVYATFLGGAGNERAWAGAVDSGGNAYVAGWTVSNDFPITPGSYDTSQNGNIDVFVTKLNAAGAALMYSTFLGGASDERAWYVKVDSASIAFVSGDTRSSDFPTTPGAFDRTQNGDWDAFAAKLNAAGNGLVYSTFLGGSGAESGAFLDLDSADNAYLSGTTASTDFPVTSGAFMTTKSSGSDVFAAKLNAAGTSLSYSTFLGGSGSDIGYFVKVGSADNAYLTGQTDSTDFPVTSSAFDKTYNGGIDVFVTQLNMSFQITVDTSPGSLQVEVDGGLHTAPYAFVCSAGSNHTLNVPSPQSSAGTRYMFASWSDSGAQSHSVTCIRNAGYTANFAVEYNITVDTQPPSLQIQVESSTYTAPYSFWCPANSVHGLYAPSPQGSGTTRYAFASWSDSGPQSHTITCTSPQTYTANFATEHQVNVTTSPVNLQVTVDGNTANAPQTYWWSSGSPHSLDVPSPQTSGTTRYVFASWSDGGAKSHNVSPSSPRTYTAAFNTEYQVTVDTSPPGLQVQSDGNMYTAPYIFWCPAGSSHTISVSSPQTGVTGTRYVFSSWSDGGAQSHSITCSAAGTYTATFTTEYQITIDTQPPSLQVQVDGNMYTAPYTFWCAMGSSHALNVPSPQVSGTTRYVFASWSDAGSQSHTITCSSSQTYTATFTTEYQITVTTSPPNLQITVDGITASAPQTFWWAAGTTHSLDVPSPQTLGTTRHVFAYWSDSGPKSHDLSPTAGGTYTAYFNTEYQVTLDTSPSGLEVQLDGTAYTAPHSFWCVRDSSRTVNVTSPQSGPVGTRYVFSGWTDGGAISHMITCSAASTRTANFTTEYQITIDASATGAQIELDGASHAVPYTFWCPAGSSHEVGTLSPQGGGVLPSLFESWSDGGAQTHMITCNAPATYLASMEANWKFIVALVFAIVLIVLTTLISLLLRRERSGEKGLALKTCLLSLLFVTVELATGVLSLFTGYLSMPPVFGLGTLVDVTILVVGIMALLAWWRMSVRRIRQLAERPAPSPLPEIEEQSRTLSPPKV